MLSSSICLQTPSKGSMTPSRRSRSSTSLALVPESRDGTQKASMRHRAHSVAVQVLGRSSSASLPVLQVMVTTTSDIRVSVSLEGARPEGRGLPAVCKPGVTNNAKYVSAFPLPASSGSAGSIEIEGFEEPASFRLVSSGSYIGSPGRFRQTLLHAPSWDWRNNGDKPTEGIAADLELASGVLKIGVRAQTVMELKRCLQLQALRDAAAGGDYDTLRAQVTKARMASVAMEHIQEGEAKLKELRERGLHVNEGCDKATVRALMNVERVTNTLGAEDVNFPCSRDANCPCNVELNPGEVLEILPGVVQECLASFGPDADMRLFECLTEAALAVDDGCVWKAGGKFIFSEFNRNQSATALSRMLLKHGQKQCAEMVSQLLCYTQTKYAGYVTAIQVNFHTHKGTFHDQHRDIYSVKQTAGPNCTCQFQDCVGTVCYSLGSSRLALLETMTDSMSSIRKCCDECDGRREFRWLHSGCSMFFNVDWNDNHTHGIPPSEEDCGPRISMAFLLAANPPSY
eukprot:TRINITY_DN76415_c0_g1_i1.p1 TRINITY_DN76415_c0_g1~~TRINITY_DN76415_c0_g1_i1.p1  ORF type:complete len:514 (+),score=69.44 TRINITY_DN76415_c0_g1_i1:83-1624(+)